MGWDTVAQLILNIGLPAALALVKKWEDKANVTAAQLQELADLSLRDARNRILAVLAAQGIDPASPQGIALLAAVS